MILSYNLTLLNINISKKSTFVRFFSLKVCIINDYSLPNIPMLQCFKFSTAICNFSQNIYHIFHFQRSALRIKGIRAGRCRLYLPGFERIFQQIIGGYSILAIPTQTLTIGGYSILLYPRYH